MTAKQKKKNRKWIILAILAIVIIGGAIVSRPLIQARLADDLSNIQTVSATVGEIVKTVSGTGNLSAEQERFEIPVEAGVPIDQVMVEIGDDISSGDLIATFDLVELQGTIWDIQDQIDSLDQQINLLADKSESRYITSGVSGRVIEITDQENGSVQEIVADRGYLALLSLDGTLQVTFQPITDTDIAPGDSVTIQVDEDTKFDGDVLSASAGWVTVTVSDRDAPYHEMAAVYLSDETRIGEGILEISQPMVITGTDGVIEDILVDSGDLVKRSTRLFKLQASPESEAYLRLLAQRSELAELLQTLLQYKAAGGLYALDVSGTIESVLLSDGQPSAAIALTGVRQLETELVINLDELDVALVSEDQPVDITIDALPNRVYTGQILEVSDQGIVGQGGTSFAATVAFGEDEDLSGLLLGMSATGKITVERREQAVLIPLQALQESSGEYFVYVGQATALDNLGEVRPVVIGISDGSFVEIASGLADGESINYYYDDGSGDYWFGGRPGSVDAQGQ